jgi:DNA repair exonuclease SbcCD nuclease subunit
MSKVALCTDIHIGVRNASLLFADYQLKFFETQFFPYLKKHKIKTVICNGDLFDTRKFTNHQVLDMWFKRFFDYMEREKIEFHLILGNHDLSLRNTLEINSPKLFLSHYKNIKRYDVPTDVEIGESTYLFLPWICASNYASSLGSVEKSNCSVCFGHLELANFEMHRGQIQNEGMDRKLFRKFISVISGHYHHRSSDGNINYLGTPYELTWIDHGDPKGFHIFDTKTNDLEFIKSPMTMFNKLYYDDKGKPNDYWKSFNVDILEQTYVKLVVVNKTDPYQFDKILTKLYDGNLQDLKIVEDFGDLDADSVDDDELEIEDTMSLTESYVDALDISEDKEKLKSILKSLYVEALNVVE